jgi:hypothetical protein
MALATTCCTCSYGLDTCTQVGSCVSFCATKADAIAAINQGVLECDPTVAAKQCPAGLECKASTACKKLSCDASGVRVQQCYGLCAPSERTMLAAKLADDGRSVRVALNAAAAPGSFACLSLFSTDKIGQDAW